MLYLGQFHVPDPFIAMVIGDSKIAVLNALEFGRGIRESEFDEVLALEGYQDKAARRWPNRTPGPAEVIAALAAERKVKSFLVPEDFPGGLAAKLTELGLKLSFAEGPLFPAREFKTKREAAAIREGNRCAALGIAAAEKLIRGSSIRGGKLFHKGEPLTSERLRFAIEVACLEAGALSLNTIAAGGDQACDPHCAGTGPLRANELIIVDVFPRVIKTGYHGDMTRTFLKGRASEAQRELVAAVKTAHANAICSVRDGANGLAIHRAVIAEFESKGYYTKRTKTGAVGFFHGTGHGLGLDVHELPKIRPVDYLLLKDAVVTVEPGLYYPGLGGCRIEDVVQVTKAKARLLSDYPYEWEFRG